MRGSSLGLFWYAVNAVLRTRTKLEEVHFPKRIQNGKDNISSMDL